MKILDRSAVFLTVLLLCLLSGCAGAAGKVSSETPQPTETPITEATETKEEEKMELKIGETPVTVEWEDNESVEALSALCADEPLTLQLSMYGGFEQVGPIGQRLPSQDVQTVTQSGDIVLYSSSQIVIFYGSNSWAYTRLGHITDKSGEELKGLLSNGDVTVTFSR